MSDLRTSFSGSTGGAWSPPMRDLYAQLGAECARAERAGLSLYEIAQVLTEVLTETMGMAEEHLALAQLGASEPAVRGLA